MLAALQSTHQHADTKAGILVAAQGALVGTAGAWNRQAALAWEHGGLAGTISASLLVLFALGLSGGAGCLALALGRACGDRPVRTASASSISRSPVVPASTCPPHGPPAGPLPDPAAERRELAETIRFLAHVAVVKHRFLMGALVFTTAMGLSAGLFLVLRPILL